MCRIFYVEGTDKEFVKKITYSLAYLAYKEGNKDGYALYINTKKRIKTLDIDIFLENIQKNNYNQAIGHLRMATTGNINIKNCHLWKFKYKKTSKRYVCGHNGTVSEYSSYGYYNRRYYYYDYGYQTQQEDNKTDSYQFFQYIFNNKIINKPKKLEEAVSEKGFHGVAMLLEENFKELIIIANQNFYCAKYEQDNNIAYVISSKRDILDIEKAKYKKSEKIKTNIFVFDVEYIKTTYKKVFENPPKKEIKEIPRGIYYIDLENKKITKYHPL